MAEAYSRNVVNVLTFGPVGAQEVMLQVKFAEVDRSAVTQLGVNFFPLEGKHHWHDDTGQFGGFGPQTLPLIRTGSTGPLPSNAPLITQHVLNLFLFRPDINFGAVIEGAPDQEPVADSGRAEPDCCQWQGSEFSGRW